MLEKITVTAVAGRSILDPETGRKITEPTKVTASPYWRRRLRDGDVALVDIAPAEPAAKSKK